MSFEDFLRPAIKERAMLGVTLQEMRKLEKLRIEDLQLLDAGLRARNYIAHKAGLVGAICDLTAKHVLEAMHQLQTQVETLAQADAIISEWIFCIEEKEIVPPTWIVECYPARIVEWVLRGVPDNLREDQITHNAALYSQLLAIAKTAMNCPCCNDQSKLRITSGSRVGCGKNHIFELCGIGTERTITLVDSTNGNSELGTVFAVPPDATF